MQLLECYIVEVYLLREYRTKSMSNFPGTVVPWPMDPPLKTSVTSMPTVS